MVYMSKISPLRYAREDRASEAEELSREAASIREHSAPCTARPDWKNDQCRNLRPS